MTDTPALLERRARDALAECFTQAGLSRRQVEILLGALEIHRVSESSVSFAVHRFQPPTEFATDDVPGSIDELARAFGTLVMDEIKETAGRSTRVSIDEVIAGIAADE